MKADEFLKENEEEFWRVSKDADTLRAMMRFAKHHIENHVEFIKYHYLFDCHITDNGKCGCSNSRTKISANDYFKENDLDNI